MNAIVGFYRGTGTDHRGRTIADVWAFDRDRLEGVHDYIQWLFPTDRPSAFNPWAPVLDATSTAELQAIPDLLERVHRSLDLMLAFYGLERAGIGATTVIGEAATIEEQGPRWWGAGDHNHLRLTRMIDSLRLLGLLDESRALEQALQGVRRDHPTGISDETARYWAAAASPPRPHP